MHWARVFFCTVPLLGHYHLRFPISLALSTSTRHAVVQRKGLFDDPAEEINTLMHAIKEDIQGLNSLVEGTQARANACRVCACVFGGEMEGCGCERQSVCILDGMAVLKSHASRGGVRGGLRLSGAILDPTSSATIDPRTPPPQRAVDDFKYRQGSQGAHQQLTRCGSIDRAWLAGWGEP